MFDSRGYRQAAPMTGEHSVTNITDRRAPNGSRWTRPDYSNWYPRLRVVDETDVPHSAATVHTPQGEPRISLPDGHSVVTCLARHRIQRARAKWGIKLPPVVA